MSPSVGSQQILRFGDFELDPHSGELRKRGVRISFQNQLFELLKLLVERQGELVTREEIRERLWPEEEFGDLDHRLNIAINKIRQALHDSADVPRFVETVPLRGYRFIAPVKGGGQGESRKRPTLPLRIKVGVAACLLAILAGYFVVQSFQGNYEVLPAQIRIAVLPFDNFTGDPEQEYFSDGFTEEVTAELGKLNPRRLGVIARTSAMPYKGTQKGVEQIGRELQVDYVLEGSVRREDERVRVTTQLIEVEDETHLWAEVFEGERQNMLALQRTVSRRVANSLAIEVLSSSPAGPSESYTNPAAYEAYLKGRYFRTRHSEESFRRSIHYFQEAIQIDTNYASAYAGLASCYCLLAGHGLEVLPPGDAMPRAKEAAMKALELDDTEAEAHAVLGMVGLKYDWDFPAADRAFQKAIDLNPSLSGTRTWYSIFLEAMGRFEEAVVQAKVGRDLDPLSLGANVNLGLQLLHTGRSQEALGWVEKALELDPDFWGAHWAMGNYYREQSRYRESIDEFRQSVSLSNGNTVSLASLGYAYALSGQRSEALEVVSRLEELAEQRYVSPAFLGFIHAGLDETDLAFERLEEAFQQRSRYLAWLKVAPEYEKLRSDPRYQQLLTRIGLSR